MAASGEAFGFFTGSYCLVFHWYYHGHSMQALASERELVLMLLDPDAMVDTGPTARRFSMNVTDDSEKVNSDLTFVLDRIFEGVCRPFKVRVEQVLQSQPSLIVSYKLGNTLEFYSCTVSWDLLFLSYANLHPCYNTLFFVFLDL